MKRLASPGATIAILSALALATPALAQQGVPPPTPPATESPGAVVFLYYTVIVLLGAVTIVVSIIPGKRGHQD